MFCEIYWNSQQQGSVCPLCGHQLSVDVENKQEDVDIGIDKVSSTLYSCLCGRCDTLVFVYISTTTGDEYKLSSRMFMYELDWIQHQQYDLVHWDLNLNATWYYDVTFLEDEIWLKKLREAKAPKRKFKIK